MHIDWNAGINRQKLFEKKQNNRKDVRGGSGVSEKLPKAR